MKPFNVKDTFDTPEIVSSDKKHFTNSHSSHLSNFQARESDTSRNFRNLYVGNLPLNVNTDQMTALFQAYGSVTHCVILSTLDTQARRRGFIVMSSADEARLAIKGLNGFVWFGYPIEVSFALVQRSGGPLDPDSDNTIQRNVPRSRFNTGPRKMPDEMQGYDYPSQGTTAFLHPAVLRAEEKNSQKSNDIADPNSVLVSGLDPVAIIDDDDFARVLQPYGFLAAATLCRDDHGASRGFGIATFAKETDAAEACARLNQIQVHGRRVQAQQYTYNRAYEHLEVPHPTPCGLPPTRINVCSYPGQSLDKHSPNLKLGSYSMLDQSKNTVEKPPYHMGGSSMEYNLNSPMGNSLPAMFESLDVAQNSQAMRSPMDVAPQGTAASMWSVPKCQNSSNRSSPYFQHRSKPTHIKIQPDLSHRNESNKLLHSIKSNTCDSIPREHGVSPLDDSCSAHSSTKSSNAQSISPWSSSRTSPSSFDVKLSAETNTTDGPASKNKLGDTDPHDLEHIWSDNTVKSARDAPILRSSWAFHPYTASLHPCHGTSKKLTGTPSLENEPTFQHGNWQDRSIQPFSSTSSEMPSNTVVSKPPTQGKPDLNPM